jgi:hypothetical protein
MSKVVKYAEENWDTVTGKKLNISENLRETLEAYTDESQCVQISFQRLNV